MTQQGGSTGGPLSGLGSVGSDCGASVSCVAQAVRDESGSSTQRLSGHVRRGISKSGNVGNNMSKKPKAKRSAKDPVEADARVYFTDGAARRKRWEISQREGLSRKM